LLGALERLHQDRWRAKSLAGALTHERDRSFHRQVAGLFLKSQILKLYALRVRERIVAVLYAFRHSKRTYFYLSGFDPEYGCLSVGSVLLCHAIEQALRDECHVFDFLRGQEPYKYRWGARDQATFTRIIRKKS
jgi:CelD/BcsL family acetyltransferase involved in cellulose biosynthesis